MCLIAASAEPRATGVSSTATAGDAFMATFGEAAPPLGYVNFCRLNHDECARAGDFTGRVVLTPTRRAEIAGVNDRVNAMIRPATDLELYGAVEHWTLPISRGDCEDYVLLKRHLLIEKGWPSSALLITVVRDEQGDGHAVLTVRTRSGDFILDNKQPRILPWRDTGYEYIKRQSFRDPTVWVSLSPSPSQVAGAASSPDDR
ncbi:MAG: transglutaminase-like cysteine peptidase [Hyphomicrobiales bacterium]|nr:transglutaminase-like cysteine peptidase [Hyphomicrobiales bacterium]